MKSNRLSILITCLAMAGLLSSACGDDTETGGKKDTGVPDMGADVGVDGTTPTPDMKISPDTKKTPDMKLTPDMPVTPKGVACTVATDCYPTAPFCDPTNKVCVECVKTTDCKDSTSGGKCSAGNCTCAADTDCTGAMAMGGKCISSSSGKFCGCAATTDCAKSHKGPTCDTKSGNCSCSANTECKTSTFTVCSKAFGSSTLTIKNCNQACKADTECAKELGRKVCDTTAGGCVECNKSADCAYPSLPWNTTCTAKKFCVECEKSADCTAKSLGNTCSTQGWCECANDASCASNANGKKCDSGLKACSCKTAADCPTGKKCVVSPYLPTIKYCK